MTTKIEWSEEYWNPIIGCSHASPGCANCYAEPIAWMRMHHNNAKIADKYASTVMKTKAGNARWTGKINLSEDALLKPLRRKKPTIYFVNSMSDLFHPHVPHEWIDHIFAVMALCPQHIFQVLTKRTARMRAYISHLVDEQERWERLGDAAAPIKGNEGYTLAGEAEWPLPNVWLGVSVEDQQRADERIPDLLATPAAIGWLSCEPLLGPLTLNRIEGRMDTIGERWILDALRGEAVYGSVAEIGGISRESKSLDWIVCGGESGKGSRPMHPDWARSLRDQCADAGVPFFFKQWGDWWPWTGLMDDDGIVENGVLLLHSEHGDPPIMVPSSPNENDAKAHWWPLPDDDHVQPFSYRVGKKAAGRKLDGVEHNAMPEVAV